MSSSVNQFVQGVLTNAQLLAMGTGANAIQLIPAQGAGTLIKPFRVTLILRTSDFTASPHLNLAGNVQMVWGTAAANAIAGTGGTQICLTTPATTTGPFANSFWTFDFSGGSTNSVMSDFTITSISANAGGLGAGVTSAAGFPGNNQPISLVASAAVTNQSGAGLTLQYRIEYTVMSGM